MSTKSVLNIKDKILITGNALFIGLQRDTKLNSIYPTLEFMVEQTTKPFLYLTRTGN
jgi:hypothetical protein